MSDQPEFKFTYTNLLHEYESCLNAGYKVITCKEYVEWKKVSAQKQKVLVNRVDVDFSIKKAARLADIFAQLKIHATFFIRLHAPEYNPFSFEGYRIIKRLINEGHEIGYHSEVVDEAVIWNEDAVSCLKRDIDVINRMFNITIKGVASHGGMTGNNNLDFWKNRKPSDFGLRYEAYDRQPEFNLFYESFYVSDSEWTRWKCYDRGEVVKDDRRTLAEHSRYDHPVLYSLIHPDTYFNRHFYENGN